MPLLAFTGSGEPLIAPLMSDEAWEGLSSAKDRDAWMPWSRRRAIPKVSRLGTRFFAHPPGHAPEGAKESDLHLYLKAQCLIGAAAVGWEALPEQTGRTPDGQEWRADVLCRRPGKAWSIGFEVQVQLQGKEAYRQRQERFAASGIRTLWLVAHEPAALQGYWRKPDQHLPAFRTTTWNDPGGRPGAHVHVDGLSLSVADFVAGALARQLRWYENGRHAIVMLVLREDQCWHRTCRNQVLLVHTVESQGGGPLDLEIVQAMEGYGQAYEKAQKALPSLADSPWPFRRVLASRCPHCRREVRYQPAERTSYTPMNSRSRGLAASSGTAVRVPIGITLPDEATRADLSPHAGWHWGSEDRWPDWAPLGGIGLISKGAEGN
ncbi:MAG TPA: hypothetical protein VHL98_02350 [Microvirga sp.]|jgi:hypothetical protein|nr:hypothetical protein [Microvirga sp.]